MTEIFAPTSSALSTSRSSADIISATPTPAPAAAPPVNSSQLTNQLNAHLMNIQPQQQHSTSNQNQPQTNNRVRDSFGHSDDTLKQSFSASSTITSEAAATIMAQQQPLNNNAPMEQNGQQQQQPQHSTNKVPTNSQPIQPVPNSTTKTIPVSSSTVPANSIATSSSTIALQQSLVSIIAHPKNTKTVTVPGQAVTSQGTSETNSGSPTPKSRFSVTPVTEPSNDTSVSSGLISKSPSLELPVNVDSMHSENSNSTSSPTPTATDDTAQNKPKKLSRFTVTVADVNVPPVPSVNETDNLKSYSQTISKV